MRLDVDYKYTIDLRNARAAARWIQRDIAITYVALDATGVDVEGITKTGTDIAIRVQGKRPQLCKLYASLVPEITCEKLLTTGDA